MDSLCQTMKKMSTGQCSTVIGSELKDPAISELDSTMEELLKVKP